MGGDGRRLLPVSMAANGVAIASGSLYVPTALLARRDAIAVDESGEVWAVTLMELRACTAKNQRAKRLAEHGPASWKKFTSVERRCDQQQQLENRPTTNHYPPPPCRVSRPPP